MSQPKTKAGKIQRLKTCAAADGFEQSLHDLFRLSVGEATVTEQPRSVMCQTLKQALRLQGKADRSAGHMAVTLEGYVFTRLSGIFYHTLDMAFYDEMAAKGFNAFDRNCPESERQAAWTAAAFTGREAALKEFSELAGELGLQERRPADVFTYSDEEQAIMAEKHYTMVEAPDGNFVYRQRSLSEIVESAESGLA